MGSGHRDRADPRGAKRLAYRLRSPGASIRPACFAAGAPVDRLGYLANFRFECSFYTWIYRIVTNLCLDHLRRRKSRREEQSVVVDSSGGEMDLLSNISDDRSMANPERELERKLLGDRIQEALSHLTPRERMVFELKHYQGLRLRTIGEMLNTTEETAKNTLFRATRKLRANLAAIR
jgi:RNA polymerase sigma-70 factor (ECF subfamily)